jgi:uncharacterized protein
MPASRTGPPSVQDRLHAEFQLIRANVSGVHGSVVATSDGFLVAHDVPDLDSTDIAALLAASRSLATRGAAITGRGQFREVITRGSLGYVAVYAAGDNAIVGVIGDAELNVAMLHYRVHDIIMRITAYASEFRRWASPEPAASQPGPATQPRPTAQSGPTAQQCPTAQQGPSAQQSPPAQLGPTSRRSSAAQQSPPTLPVRRRGR